MSFKEKLDNALLSANASVEYFEETQRQIEQGLKEAIETRDCLEELKSDFEYIESVFN